MKDRHVEAVAFGVTVISVVDNSIYFGRRSQSEPCLLFVSLSGIPVRGFFFD